MARTRIPWSTGSWTHPPVATRTEGTDLVVEAREGSDAWRHTSYGFVHDSEHALVAPMQAGTAVEVVLTSDFREQFDQAGIFLRAAEDQWVKAGLELSDGVSQVGAVVTAGSSDWSVAPTPEWSGRRVRLRASWDGGALTVRAGLDGENLRLVRVAPLRANELDAGPFCCAPARAGLEVRFHEWSANGADAALHPEE